MKLKSFEVSSKRMAEPSFTSGMKVIDRLIEQIPRKEDGTFDFYQLGRGLKHLIDESKEFKQDMAAVDNDVIAFALKKLLTSVVDNPACMQDSVLAQFALGSELLPKILELAEEKYGKNS